MSTGCHPASQWVSFRFLTNQALCGNFLLSPDLPWDVWHQIDPCNLKVVDSFDVEDKSNT
jgi:hypothetical protein